MKEKLAKVKEFILKLSRKTKVLIGVGAVVLIAAAVIIVLMLNRKEYEVLYSDVNTDEVQQIIGLLQESAVDYRYDGKGTISVPAENVDRIKADLASQGYPKSGFTYDIFTNNATMMTTDSDKQTYKLYELQNRIGATISLFDNVKDAKVTIALGEQQKYALDDSEQEEASASVVMIMKDNGSPTEEQAIAVQNLVSKAIPGMTIENVAIFDGNGKDVSVDPEEGSKVTSEDTSAIARMVEDQISEKVMHVLTPIFGTGNVRVSARARVNMETLYRESITYSTPEKIDANDKTGLLSNSSGSSESNTEDGTAGGVAGTETNADVPEYNTDENENDARYANQQYDREYLFDQLKEQGEVPAGAIEDLSVGVTVNGEDLGDIDEYDLISLVGNAAGIDLVDQDEKITVLAAPFYDSRENDETQTAGGSGFFARRSNWIIMGIIVAILLIAGIVLALILARRKKKAKEKETLERAAEQAELTELLDNLGARAEAGAEEPAEEGAGAAVLAAEGEEEAESPIVDAVTEKSMELRQQIRDFAEQSPEIAAQMLRNWLSGGESDARRNG